ncbi:hypothetical protein C6500_20770 [Candidatus Poribacteria bacterium]|nr:MAG: hypothetical protein C6500_20770 [Candidatus Poribacteria bacterium]
MLRNVPTEMLRTAFQDYFLYDAEGRYLPSSLMGFELVNGAYVGILANPDGGIHSGALNLDFHLRDDGDLAIYAPSVGEWLQTPAEVAEARAETAEARAETAEAEVARLREQLARLQRDT